MTTDSERSMAHEKLLLCVRDALTVFLSSKLVIGTDQPRPHQTTRERYLAAKIPKKIMGFIPGYGREKIFAAYPWDPSAGSVMCYLLVDRTGLLEEVKRVMHAFHDETKLDLILAFETPMHEATHYLWPQKPLSMPPPPDEIQRQERARHAAGKFSRR